MPGKERVVPRYLEPLGRHRVTSEAGLVHTHRLHDSHTGITHKANVNTA